MRRFRLTVLLALVALLGCTSGCGSKPVKVTGKIIQSKVGSPLKEFPPKAGKFDVLFIPIGSTGNSDRGTRADPSGSFMIDNLPVGKYKVAVSLQDIPGSPDKLGDKFAKGKTTIEVEVNKDNAPIDIDISQ